MSIGAAAIRLYPVPLFVVIRTSSTLISPSYLLTRCIALTYLVFFTSVALFSLDATPSSFHLRHFRALALAISTLSVAFLPMSFLSSPLNLRRLHCPSQICGRILSSPCSSLSRLFLPHGSILGTLTGRDSVSGIDELTNSRQHSLICSKSRLDCEHITT
ncbi:hypothetical protein BC827DRAFT_1198013 [Russula dissimulans]|nr:hypothetical protein BC827DRAFT_1198013 [Russula dissimulans]